MKSLYVLVLLLIFGCSASSQKSNEEENKNAITLSGKIAIPQKGDILLEEVKNNRFFPIDTIHLKDDNTYVQQVAIPNPGYYRLNLYNKQFVMLILNDEDIEINADGNSMKGLFEVKGSTEHDFVEKIQRLSAEFNSSEEIQVLNNEFGEASNNQDQEKIDELRSRYFALEKEHKQQMVEQFMKTKAPIAAVNLLQSGRVLDQDNYFEVYQHLAEALKKEMPEAPFAKDFIGQVETMKKLAIGQVAPEIELPNPEGEIIKLSSLRGNYVLLDFWAKWCRPCRMENPNVVRMYNKYNKKGFEVFGVSLDRRKEDWLKAIEEDNLHWTQVSDLKYWQSEAARTYNIKAIPFALLLDPEGKIIGKNLRGPALESKLEEIFGEI